MKLTLKKAFELSIEKWEYLSTKDYTHWYNSHADIKYSFPHLFILEGECGLCEYYSELDAGCYNCPLFIDERNCSTIGHLWDWWSRNPNKANAQAVLDLIKEKYKAHLKRYYKAA